MKGQGAYLLGNVGGEVFKIENTVKQVVAFIMEHRFENVRITNKQDGLLIETVVGSFVNYCRDQSYLANELLPELAPVQKGDAESDVFVEYKK